MGKFLKSTGLFLAKYGYKAGAWLAGHPEVFQLVKELAEKKK